METGHWEDLPTSESASSTVVSDDDEAVTDEQCVSKVQYDHIVQQS